MPETRSNTSLTETDWRLWAARLVVVLFAIATGLAIAAMTWLSDTALAYFRQVAAYAWWTPLVWTPVLTCGVVYVTRRWFDGAAGSGIPQVIASLATRHDPAAEAMSKAPHVSHYVSLRLSISKAFLTTAGLLAGLSTGREGPSVQVAAGIMHHARHWLPRGSGISRRGLIAAGGAAGVAAAFNTPLGGVMFAIEQLASQPERKSSGLLIVAIVLAGMVAMSIHGDHAYFGRIETEPLTWLTLLPASITVLAAGLLGGLFALALTRALSGQWDAWLPWRHQRPLLLAACCGLAVAAIGLATDGRTFGSGYLATRQLVESGHDQEASLDFLLRMLSTWLSLLSGIPGGVFAPALAMGASLGQQVALLLAYPDTRALIAIGMTAFLAAVTQAPLTSAVVVMEMLAGHTLVMPLLASALAAHSLSRWITPSMYDELAKTQLEKQKAHLPEPEAGQVGSQRLV